MRRLFFGPFVVENIGGADISKRKDVQTSLVDPYSRFKLKSQAVNPTPIQSELKLNMHSGLINLFSRTVKPNQVLKDKNGVKKSGNGFVDSILSSFQIKPEIL